jgi:hypothetical protein
MYRLVALYESLTRSTFNLPDAAIQDITILKIEDALKAAK